MSGEAVTGAATGAASGASFGPWGAAIGAAVGLVGGLMSSRAKKEEEERRRKFEGQMMGLQTQSNAAAKWSEGEQNAFGQMMSGYKSALGG